MLGIALDVLALWAIASLMARRNMAEDWFRFFIFAAGLIVAGVLTFLAGNPVLALAVYFVVLFLGMRFLIGATWLGSLIGSVLFVVYRIIFALLWNTMFK